MDDYWNNIVVGNMEINDSQHFFELRREAKRLLDGQMKSVAATTTTTTSETDKENVQRNNQTLGSSELMRIVEERLGACKVAPSTTTTKIASAPKATKNHPDLLSVPTQSALRSLDTSPRPNSGARTKSHTAAALTSPFRSLDTSPRPISGGARPKTATTTSTATVPAPTRAPPKRRPQSATETAPAVPNAYRYQAIYEQKLQRKAERLLAEERKAREVVARPMPNFAQAHRQLEHMDAKRTQLQRLMTCPHTPDTLKTSREAAQRRQQRCEEYQRQKNAIAAPKARPAEVLAQEPFKPHFERREIVPQPFQLPGDAVSGELRELKERRAREQEQRRQLEAAEQAENERRLRKEVRKNTVFKARPNPFA